MKLNININDEPVILLDRLTLDDIKAKYSWILNAKTKNAILGQQGNKIVWYSGDWIDGEWYDGIWYSGNFYDGIWETGEWYSWQLDMAQLMDNKIIIEEKNDTASKFHKGIWQKGTFNGGTFGDDTEINWSSSGDTEAIWESGNFNNGVFQNSLFKTGTWKFGSFENSWWMSGSFFNGYFNKGIWETGEFYGGDFIEGTWMNGTFDQANTNIASRFGVNPDLTATTYKCLWENGTFIRGEFYSGDFKTDDGTSIPSINNQISVWKDGLWKNGFWFGGQFEQGTWMNGTWYGGVWGTWASDWSDPKFYEQKRVDAFSGTTDDFSQINFETLSDYTDFDRVYVGSTTGSQELEVTGTTYMDGENKITGYNNTPPFYYFTNYENLTTGFTSYLNDSEFEIDNLGINVDSPWLLSGYTENGDSIISGETFWYEQTSGVTGTTVLLKQENTLLPAFNTMTIDIGLDSWVGGDVSDKIFITLIKRQSGGTISNEDIDLVTFGSLTNSASIDLDDDVISVELKLETNNVGNLNVFSIDYLNINEIPYFHSTSDYPLSGVIDMEGNSSKFSNQEGDIHKLYLTVNTLDNVDLTVRLLDDSGNTSSVIENGSSIVQDYFYINGTGFYELVFYEDTDLDEVFLNFTSTKDIFNEPYELELKCHVVTYRTSKLITNSSGERLYSGDEIYIRTILKFDTVLGEKNNYKFYLTDLNNNVVSTSHIVQEESDFNEPDFITTFVLTGTTKVDDYRLNIDIYRESNYSWFDSNIQVQTLRVLEDNPWINPENIVDEVSSSYTYYKDRTGRNDVNVLVLSGFTFDIPENSTIKGFKFKITRAGFYDNSESVLGSVKDRIFNVDYTEFRNLINGSLNFPDPDDFSVPTAYKIETVEYGQYEDYFGIESFNWTVDRANKLRLVYQPISYKSLRLSDGLFIEGRLYRIQARAFYQTSPTWENGLWVNGLWINGTFEDGKFLNGTFLDGDISGIINSQF
jgi:hypothetical protein